MSGYISTYTTLAGSNYGFTLNPTKDDERPHTPSGLVVTQAVQTKEGWRGQVIVDKEIVWESGPILDGGERGTPGDAALVLANSRVVEVLRQLFAEE